MQLQYDNSWKLTISTYSLLTVVTSQSERLSYVLFAPTFEILKYNLEHTAQWDFKLLSSLHDMLIYEPSGYIVNIFASRLKPQAPHTLSTGFDYKLEPSKGGGKHGHKICAWVHVRVFHTRYRDFWLNLALRSLNKQYRMSLILVHISSSIIMIKLKMKYVRHVFRSWRD